MMDDSPPIPPAERPAPARIWAGAALWLILLALGLAPMLAQHLRVSQPAAELARRLWEKTNDPRPLLDIPRIADPDSAYYIKYAQELAAPGAPDWRVRHTNLDGEPGGRDVHWAALNMWWLEGLGAVRAAATGEPIAQAILRAAVWANPLLLALAAGAFSLAVWRGAGLGYGALALAGVMLLHPESSLLFGYALPDHHGWQGLTSLGLALGLALRILRSTPPSPSPALGWNGHLSAFAGGCLLWLGASQAVIVYAALGLGAGLAMLLAMRQLGGETLPAEFWRRWGLAGAAWGLGFYLLQNAPGPFGMRLEVNHPLYLIAWALAGEALCRWSRLTGAGWPGARRLVRDAVALAICVLAAGLCALVLVRAPVEWMWLKDPVLQRSINQVLEARHALFWILQAHQWPDSAYPLPAWLAATVLLALILRRRVAVPTRSQALALIMLYSAVTLLAALALVQGRWLGAAVFLSAALAVVTLSLVPKQRRSLWLGGLLGSAALIHAWCFAPLILDPPEPGPQLARAYEIIARSQLGYYFQGQAAASAGKPAYLLTGASPISLTLFLHSPVRTLGTMYWENTRGNRLSMELWAMDDEAALLKEFRRLGITHVIVPTRPDAIQMIFLSATGNVRGSPRSLIIRLAHPQPRPPAWLTRVTELDTEPISLQDIRVYKVDLPPAG